MIKSRYILVAFLWIGFSCHQESKIQHKGKAAIATSKLIFKSPANEQIINIGENITIQVQHLDTVTLPDSVQFFMDGVHCGSVRNLSETLTMNTEHAKSGTHTISAIARFSSGTIEQQHVQVKFYPHFQAPVYTYQVVHTFSHDKRAYTQGLIFDEGELIESTGLKGESSLRRVKIETGEVTKQYTLPADVFGEGIASFDHKVLLISWMDKVAFVFDKSTLAMSAKMNFPYNEGWGLTYDGKEVIMSDGSAHLYFLDKNTLAESHRIEVCDNHGPVEKLNELEYIDGEIWANRYYSDTIVRIDPETGIVLGRIDMSGLLSAADYAADTNVLNGIAYDPETKRIWVTGKNWPKLFQITVKQRGQ